MDIEYPKSEGSTIQHELNSIRSILNNIKSKTQMSPSKLHTYYDINIDEEYKSFCKGIDTIKNLLTTYKGWCSSNDDLTIKRVIAQMSSKCDKDMKMGHIFKSLKQCKQRVVSCIENCNLVSLNDDVVNPYDIGEPQVKLKNVLKRLKFIEESIPVASVMDSSSDLILPVDTTVTIEALCMRIIVTLTSDASVSNVNCYYDNVEEPALSTSFLNVLKNKQFSKFEKILEKIVVNIQRTMNLAEIYGKQDVEKSIRIVESDISLIREYERNHLSASKILLENHGILKKSYDGYKIYFYCSPHAIQKYSDECLLENPEKIPGLYSCKIQFEVGSVPSPLIMQSSIIEIDNNNPISINWAPNSPPKHNDSEYYFNPVIYLSNPLILQVGLLKKILKITLSNSDPQLYIPSSNDPSKRGTTEMMSLYQEYDPNFIYHNDGQTFRSNIISVEGFPSHQYFICSSQPECIVVRRIPFTHLSQLHKILSILRQQIVHQELLYSCFNFGDAYDHTINDKNETKSNTKKRKREDEDTTNNNATPDKCIAIELQSSVEGNKILWKLFSVLPNANKTLFSCTFAISENGHIDVKVEGKSEMSINHEMHNVRNIPQIVGKLMTDIMNS